MKISPKKLIFVSLPEFIIESSLLILSPDKIFQELKIHGDIFFKGKFVV